MWDASATEELIESICQNFPAGGLLRIKNTQGFYFAPREFAGAPVLNGCAPSYLILDGQQRLTSLYQALYGEGNYRYFIHLGGLITGESLEDCVFYLRKSDARKQYPPEAQAKTLTFPLWYLFQPGKGFEEWLDQMLDIRNDGDDQKSIKQDVRTVRKRWIENVEQYEFPMVTLAEDTSADAVCTIFETLNRTGVKLSVFDLLAARFWPEAVKLRDLWAEAQTEHPILTEFGIDPYYLLQVVSLVTGGSSPSCKRGDLLRMGVDRIQTGWCAAVKGMAAFLQMLSDDCGIIESRWLPYNTSVVPGAAICTLSGSAQGPSAASIRHRTQRWFWCSSFGQRYEKASNSTSAKDWLQARPWFAQSQQPEAITEYRFDTELLRETTYRQRALYRGVIALIIREGSRDFHTGEKISAAMIQAKKIDDHHVFPRGYLKKLADQPNGTLQESVLNKTLIDRITNIRISDKPPSVYLAEIEGEIGPEQLRKVLDSHLLPSAPESALRRDDFEGFLKERQEIISRRIGEVTA